MTSPGARLRLIDLLALVLGTAIGLAPLGVSKGYVIDRPLPVSTQPRLRDLLMRGQMIGASMLAGWSVVIPLIGRRRRERPSSASSPHKRSGSSPGRIACWVAVLGVVGHLVVVGAQRASKPPSSWLFSVPTDVALVFFPLSYNGGLLVGGAWFALLKARAWRSEPTWSDRLGRAVGGGWIALLLLAQVRAIL